MSTNTELDNSAYNAGSPATNKVLLLHGLV